MRAGPKGLRAESARAVGLPAESARADGVLTVGRGKTFDRSTGFFYENGRNSETKSQKIVPKVGNEWSL